MKWVKSGAPWIWLTAGAVSISLLIVMGLLLLIGWKGLSYFWPSTLYEYEVKSADGAEQRFIGQVYQREQVSWQQLGMQEGSEPFVERWLIKTANRGESRQEFVSLLSAHVTKQHVPDDVAVIERSRNGLFFGYPVAVIENGERYPLDKLETLLTQSEQTREQIEELEQYAIGAVNWELEKRRLERRRLAQQDKLTAQQEVRIEREVAALELQHEHIVQQLAALDDEVNQDWLVVLDSTGDEYLLPLADVLDLWYPNKMRTVDKIVHWGRQIGKFVSDDPREANTDGGVFPAIFGTVLMVLLMSVIVTPLGVIAAVYLNEYARNNAFTRLIRIAVINLAGVPSIVYGVFGLGFFVYTIGGSVDALFYSESLPAPTFGTPGLLWSALTLALLTLPVVIVSTEEGLGRVPFSVREGSMALGATQFETLWRIVLPMATPAIMTGLILAIARAAGEVAPLMLVGVVKMAPALPIDANFPYLHLERKFMHLGYHIYDVGFQSPNIEAARPLVYATSFLLVMVIVSLNLTAIGIRNHLRDKFRLLEQ